jgi:hypothetical protein
MPIHSGCERRKIRPCLKSVRTPISALSGGAITPQRDRRCPPRASVPQSYSKPPASREKAPIEFRCSFPRLRDHRVDPKLLRDFLKPVHLFSGIRTSARHSGLMGSEHNQPRPLSHEQDDEKTPQASDAESGREIRGPVQPRRDFPRRYRLPAQTEAQEPRVFPDPSHLIGKDSWPPIHTRQRIEPLQSIHGVVPRSRSVT